MKLYYFQHQCMRAVGANNYREIQFYLQSDLNSGQWANNWRSGFDALVRRDLDVSW